MAKRNNAILASLLVLAATTFAILSSSQYVQENRPFWNQQHQQETAQRENAERAARIAAIEDTLRVSGVKIALPCKALDGFAFSLDATELTDDNIAKIQSGLKSLQKIAPAVPTEIRLGMGIDRRVIPLLIAANKLVVLETNGATLAPEDVREIQSYHPQCEVVVKRKAYTYN